MNTSPGFAALFVVAFSSVSLAACAAPAGAPPAGSDGAQTTETAAQSLVLSCNGTYTRPSEDGKGELRVVVGRDQDGKCTVAGYSLGDDHSIKSANGGKGLIGTWEGDETSFVMCNDAHCVHWTRSVVAGER